MQTIETHIQAYIRYLHSEHFAGQTIKDHGIQLKAFAVWLAINCEASLENFDRDRFAAYKKDIATYVTDAGTTLSHNGQHKRIYALRAFFRWLLLQKIVAFNPTVEERGHIVIEPETLAFYKWGFLKRLKTLNYSPVTVKALSVCIDYFLRWTSEKDIRKPAEITRETIGEYQTYLFEFRKGNGEPLTFGTQTKRLGAVRLLFRYLVKENKILYNPTADMEFPRVEFRLPRHILTAEEAEKILSVPDINTHLGVRDRAILETLYSTGMRRAELYMLNLYDVDYDRGTVTVRQGKGKKDRVVPIGTRALYWVRKYVYETRPGMLTLRQKERGALFLSETGARLSLRQLSLLGKDYIEKAGVTKSGSCHIFRHTMATLMLENGADTRFIQQMLGHASLKSTQIYTHVSILKLKEVHERTHPAKAKERHFPRLAE